MPEASARDMDDVVAAARGGDAAAFETLVRDNADAVYGHALRFFGDRSIAEDATQEVFIKVYRSLAGFDGRSSFSTWLFRLTRNTCIDMMRRSARRPTPMDPLDMPQPGTGDIAEGAVARVALEQAVATLPPEDRDALNAVTLFGLSYEEAGGMLNVPAGTVKSRVFRARRTVLSLLGLTKREA
jgi:RNA polymerase sigma-70 factor (ECF subfamily)